MQYGPVIDTPPKKPAELRAHAVSNDTVTIDTWRDTWVKNMQANAEKFDFAANSIGQLWGTQQYKPVLVAGSGPSLKRNIGQLKDRREMCLVSCLHNFHFMEDNEVAPEYYVTLDAGPIVIDEVFAGGKHSPEHYWELTKNRTLLAYIGSPPELFEKWQGKVLWFSCPVSDQTYLQTIEKLNFNVFVSTGGNVLGAAMYIAKGFMGANPVVFVGADFSFDNYDIDKPRFHPWDSSYDEKMGNCVRLVDVYGNAVPSWPSYAGFKSWFDHIASAVCPGLWFNCTEGGCLGAYPEGNISAFKTMDLADFYRMYFMNDEMEEQAKNPATEERKLLF